MCEQARVLSEFAATGEGTGGSAPCLHRGGEALQEKSHTRWWRVTRHHALRGSSLTGASDVHGDDNFYAPVPISVSLQGSSTALPQEEVERMPQPLSTFRSSRSSSSSLDQLEEHSSLDQPEEHRKGSYESLDEPEVDYSDGEQATGSAGSSLVDVSRSSSAGAQHPERPRRDGSPIYANFPPLPSPSSPPQPSPEDQPLRFLSDHWAEYDARHVGRKYYYNFRTGQRSWKPPRRRNEAPRPPLATVYQPPESQRTVVVLSSASPPASRRKGPPPLPPAKKPGLSHKGSLSLPRDSLQEKAVQHNGNSTFYYGRGANAPFQAASEKWYSSTEDAGKASQPDRPKLSASSSLEEDPEARGRDLTTFSSSTSSLNAMPGSRATQCLTPKLGRLKPTPPPTLPLVSSTTADANAKHARALRTRSMILPEDFTLRGSAIADAIESLDAFEMVTRQGTLNKTELVRGGKKQKKSWTPTFVVLTNRNLFLYKDINSAQEKPPGKSAELQINLAGAVIDWSPEKSKRRNVFQLSTTAGQKVLLQDDNVQTSKEWFDTISAAIRRLPNGLGLVMGWRPEDIPSSVPEESPSHQSAPQPTPEATPPQTTSSKWGKKPSRSKSIKQHQQAARSPPLSCDAAASALDSGGGGPPSPQERKNRIRDKLRHFFVRRPTLESLQEKGIFKDEPVFGCNLAHLCERDRSSVPRFVRECILEIERRDMTADGLYRASGNLSQVQKVRCHVNQDDYSVLALEEDIHVLTGALKMFFRHMKEPLFPFNLFNKVLRAVGQPTRAARLAAFRDLLGELPRQNYDTLKYLLRHLLRVTEHSDQNRMHVQNLAIVFGPTLLSSGEEPRNLALDMMQQNQIIEFLLLEYSFLFL
ncbi:rho GTPase-activating protein 15 [Ixodes scapularis]|uniref:rho GTPase-activating protein 15 n=1 Tax=Ixodes scapularis TaxID=6945 RepID=UPI001AA008C6|nr:rho GTPase-activating protein 15 [Ixodes scapularis]